MKHRTAAVFVGLFSIALACNLPGAAGGAGTTGAPVLATAPATDPASTHTPTSEHTATPSREYPYTIIETTLYEGEKTYTCDAGGCWREDGGIAAKSDYFYPDIEAENPEIRALTDSIGLPADVAADDAERWRRIRGVWAWMSRETIPIGAPGFEEPWNYLHGLTQIPADHWPSIGELAAVYAGYGKIPLGACNSKAFTFATLLYRAGVRPDALTVTQTKLPEANHLYLALRLEGRWLHLDPTCIPSHPELAAEPESVGCTGADYAHPWEIEPLPGSQLQKPMLLE